jgi:murein DD-endopeptidase MepM/ murein hydrolase activator NlpD
MLPEPAGFVNTSILIERYIDAVIDRDCQGAADMRAACAALCFNDVFEPAHRMHPIQPRQSVDPRHRISRPVFAARRWICAVLLVVGIGDASARDVYRWVDAHGVAHYTDRQPAGQLASHMAVTVIPVQAEVTAVARLQVESEDNHYNAVVSNTLAGPVEVELHAINASNITSTPSLPLHMVLKPYARVTLAQLGLVDPAQSGGFQLQLAAVPGDPNAQARPVTYLLPVDTGSWRIDQGWHGAFSHNDAQSGYAIDISVDEGTPVLAARDGMVMQVESDFDKAGLNREKYAERANVIRILHADGTMAVYAHLKLDGALVRPGQYVVAGQRIGYSGNTGFSSGPHLHFAVQVNRGIDLESVPFQMRSPSGAVAIPGAR